MEFVSKASQALKRLCFYLFILLCLPLINAHADGVSKPIDHALFNDFLQIVVNEKGEVNYIKARENRAMLEKYLSYFESPDFSLSSYDGEWVREEKLATMLNLYHAGVIRLVLEYYPVRSIQEIPGGWDLTIIHLGGKRMLSLNDLRETEILGNFRDEKIHTVLACGSKSCPAFPREVFTGTKVEGQVYESTVAFVNDPKFNEISVDSKKIKISKIFKWYAKDFQLDFGFSEHNKLSSPENAVMTFFSYYLQDPEKTEFLDTRRYKIKYQPFDWSLREWGNHLQTA